MRRIIFSLLCNVKFLSDLMCWYFLFPNGLLYVLNASLFFLFDLMFSYI